MNNSMEVERHSTPITSINEPSFNYDFLNASSISNPEMLENENEENVKFIKVPFRNGVIAVMKHPTSFTVYQHVSIRALSGSVSVLGYEITNRNKPIEVFSSEKTGLIEIKTETCENIWKIKANQKTLQELILEVSGNEGLVYNVMSHFGAKCVAILVMRIAYPVNLQFLEIYFPLALDFGLSKKKSVGSYVLNVSHPNHKPIQFNKEVEELIGRINLCIRTSKLNDANAPRVMVCGPKNIGKSSLIRYIINKLLAEHCVAYYLDTDPGQTEFTPPGVVSLTEVDQQIIGPSFCHLKDPVSMIFIGSISPNSPDLYAQSVSTLMNLYRNNYSSEPLFVNTMGWMEGLGLECLSSVIQIVKPSLLIEILTEDGVSMFDYRSYLPDSSDFIQITCNHERKTPYISGKEMREMTLLSYFGKCFSPPHLGVRPLNEIEPYCVSWDKIPLYIFHQHLAPDMVIEAISHSIVALCVVPESVVFKDTQQHTLYSEPDNECLGFGLVRAVDETFHLLYIVTPLKMEKLKKVNAIIKGNIMIPDAVILNQDIYEEPLPYTYYRAKSPVNKEKDTCSMSFREHSNEDKGPDTSERKSRTSSVSYHKAVPRRNKRKIN